MQYATLNELFSRPVFLCLFLAIIVALLNVVVGTTVQARNKRLKDLHRYLYYAVTAGYLLFLVFNYSQNNWIEYAVMLYLLIVVPWIRGITVTHHAILSSLGLILLLLIALRSI